MTRERKFLEYIVELGIRLEARTLTISYACVYYHKCHEKLPEEMCRHTVASTCMSLAAKTTNDNRLRLKSIVSVAYRILHPEQPPIPLNELEAALRQSLIDLEPIVLRFLGFDLTADLPHHLVYTISSILKDFYSSKFEKCPKYDTVVATLLQDVSVDPQFFSDHSSLTAALIIVALGIQIAKVEIKERAWVSLFSDSLSISRLQRLKRRFVKYVYNQDG
ncbi:unnamed protein product [Bursaphelenchus xylophilus]|uniref:(pine wood nematode) hypothetical protein n=1 Tax=Bursaphelenchus xylophilus TaxID=6326 RepID=A0A1I7S4Y0_BURXY|nr:unnamed protein product [Bursaphelenchus xylophilus]CAG9117488.1 unnamed protein product [Bursaphelenchus xylophilus]